MELLTRQQWQEQEFLHRERAAHWSRPALLRRSHNKPHPVEDFLFTYYPYKITRLDQWHPGIGIALECSPEEKPAWMEKGYRWADGLLFADPSLMSEKERVRLQWIRDLLERTASNSPNFGCFGMHEWAMVYRAHNTRHESSAPLRLPQAELDAFVESRPIRCSHYDAFRFFTPEARPLNQLQPCLDTRMHHEQSACIHANMDLYKWVAKSQPWADGTLYLDAFALAKDLRDLDMRASPYDLRHFDCEPICIETEAGRRFYEKTQRLLAQRAAEIRARLITTLQTTLAA